MMPRSLPLFPLLLLLPFLAHAEPPEIEVKPSLCIVDERTPSCSHTFVIRWEGTEQTYHCVRLDSDELQCWSEADRGTLDDEREVTESIRYQLDHGDADAALATAAVEVLKKDSDDRRRRRRTRHVWDIL